VHGAHTDACKASANSNSWCNLGIGTIDMWLAFEGQCHCALQKQCGCCTHCNLLFWVRACFQLQQVQVHTFDDKSCTQIRQNCLRTDNKPASQQQLSIVTDAFRDVCRQQQLLIVRLRFWQQMNMLTQDCASCVFILMHVDVMQACMHAAFYCRTSCATSSTVKCPCVQMSKQQARQHKQ